MLRPVLIVFGFATLLLGLMASVDLPNQKPRLAVELGGVEGLRIDATHPAAVNAPDVLQLGDRIIELAGRSVLNGSHLFFGLDGHRVGDRVELVVDRAGQPTRVWAVLVPSLSTGFLIVNFGVALLVWAFAMLIISKSSLPVSNVFYWMAMSLSMILFIYFPENRLLFSGGQHVSNFFGNGLIPLTSALFLHFALIYPDGYRKRWMRWLPLPIHSLALVTGAGLVFLLTQARSSMSPADVTSYLTLVDRILPIELALFFLAGLVVLILQFRASRTPSARKQISWLFWGFALGASPYLLLFELPKSFGLEPVLQEWLTILFFVCAPSAFFVSVVRHQMLAVNVVVRRSLVYSLLTIFVVSLYLALISLVDLLTVRYWGQTTPWLRVVVVLMLAAAFEPARRLAQALVDRLFYRAQQDQSRGLIDFSRELAHSLDLYQLSTSMHEMLDRLLPIESMVVFTADDGMATELVPHDELEGRKPLQIRLENLPGLTGTADSGAFAPVSLPEELAGTDMLVPLKVEDRLAGVLALGPKRSGGGFSADEHRFVKAVAAQTAVAFDRARAFKVIQDMNVSLEQKVWKRTQQLAQANDRLAEQYEQLKQLNDMKEALTRMVVHDLKNPVSTILLGLEFLDRSQVGDLPDNVTSTLNIISSTALEIQDLIANLLDVYRMEAGELQLTRSPVPLQELFDEGVRRVKILAQYRRVQIMTRVDLDLSPELDRDLLIRVLVNLLTNAVKHSRREGVIELVATVSKGGSGRSMVEIAVTNSGLAIPADLQERVFEKFFQAEAKKTGVIAGTGLGLAFCKLVVEAHGGRIWVESPVPGRQDGACFSMALPELAAEKVADPVESAEPSVSGSGGPGPNPQSTEG